MLDRAQPPRPGPPRPLTFPAFEHGQLFPGLDTYFAPLEHSRLVHLELLSPGGAVHDPAPLAGLASLTSSLLEEGTLRRSSRDLALRVEQLGGDLQSTADWDVASVSASFLGQHLEAAIELLGEVASQPAFPPEEIERLRWRTLTELKRRRAQPASLAVRHLLGAIYGDGVYGHSIIGRESTVPDIGREDVVQFNDGRIRTAGSALVAVGSFDPTQLRRMAGEALAGWHLGPQVPLPEIVPETIEATRVIVVDRPHAVQSELRVGHAGLPRVHADRAAVLVMNTLLGGKFTSRINLNLRERHAYTYGAHSRFAQRRGIGPFVIGAAVETESTAAATREILGELRRMREETVSHEELDDTKQYILGVFPYGLQTIEGVGRRLEDLAVHSLPDDYYTTMPRELASISAQDVLDAAARHLRPEQAIVVAVGPADELRRQMESLGPVEVHAVEDGSGT